MISTADVKELREKTGISFAQCKKALEDAGGNPAKALESLKAQGEVIAAKKPEFVALARDIAMQVTASAPADTTELLAQPFIKDASLTVDALVKSRVQKFGENITVPRFIRFSVLG